MACAALAGTAVRIRTLLPLIKCHLSPRFFISDAARAASARDRDDDADFRMVRASEAAASASAARRLRALLRGMPHAVLLEVCITRRRVTVSSLLNKKKRFRGE